MISRRAALGLLATVALSSGCAGSSGTPAVLTFPTGTAALAGTTLFTSPDGGIYQNADPIKVLMVVRASADPVMHQLGAATSSWRGLRRFGDFTYVGVEITNRGAAGSDPQLNSAQIAVDFAPQGTSSGSLRHFYHPTYPLAILRTQPSDVQCGAHIDPGHNAVMVLLYPPVSATDSIVWGMYQTFAVRVPFKGGVPPASGWHAAPCTPPQPQPASP
ncbi:MAG: hypothetical protein JOZ75_00235 [Candidatus Dormibacteraeota bacterium]|nr:hypothetical protein [Candidatus Dormibacteraeota bacterium]